MYRKKLSPTLLNFIFFILIFSWMPSFQTLGYCSTIPDQYVPDYLYDGYKSITRIKSIHQVQGQPTQTTYTTTYSWISGQQYISGVNCWRMYSSLRGFYQDHSDTMKSAITYSALVGNEIRYYGFDYIMKDRTIQRIRYSPYQLGWKYGMQMGFGYTNNYSYSSSNCSSSITETIRPTGYETVSGPYGTFPNCLIWERSSTTRMTCSGYTQTITSKLTFWNALNIGSVKYYDKGDNYTTTVYYDVEVVSEPPPTDSDNDGVNDDADNCPYTYNPGQDDSDSDNTGDACDNCPLDANKIEPGICGCGTFDQDSDSDGVFDCNDAFPNDANEWLDTDGDGTGNNADLDDDDDGMPDVWEKLYDLDPLVDDASEDPDCDGYSNLEEYLAGTNPQEPEAQNVKATPWIPLLLLDE